MNFNLFVSLLVNGLAMGMVYALLAMGLIMLFRSAGVMNFAQGMMLAVGAYISYATQVQADLPLYAAIPLCLASYVVFGLIFMACIYLPLKDTKFPAAIVVATMGTSSILSEACTLIWGGEALSVPYLVTSEEGKSAYLTIGGVSIQWQYILTTIVGVVLIFLVYILFDKLYVGKMMEAAAQDKYTASLIGIPKLVTIAITYAIAISLGCIGGFMVSPVTYCSVSLSSLQLRAFASVVIGGTRSIKGAVIGALLVGLVEAFATVNLSNDKDAVVFILLIVFLLVKPDGLVRSKIGDKA